MTIVRLTPRERGQKGVPEGGLAGAGADVDLGLAECDLAAAFARQLRALHQSYHAGDLPALGRAARSVIAMADQLGLSHEAHVAADVLRCSEGKDAVALAATLSRLTRLLDAVIGGLSASEPPF